MALDLVTIFGLAAVLGVASHLGWFINGELDFAARQYLAIWTAIQAAAFSLLGRMGYGYLASFALQSCVSGAWLVGLWGSMLIYRVFFHKLRHFPGPLAWKLTKFTQMFKNASDSKGYVHLDKLHKEYGSFVRTGPNEICCIDAAAPSIVLGPGSKCHKAIWYDVGLPLVSMHSCRDKKLHDIRRRTWDKGFNAKSLRDYEARVSSYVDILMDQLKSFGGGPFNASKWFNYYSFDVMGDLAFGESFHMLEKGEKHFAIPLLEAGMDPMNVIPAVPWLFYIISAMPFLAEPYHKFIKWSGEQAERRRQMKVSEPDIMHHLIQAPPMSTDESVNKNWEVGDARLIIVAGSDTTAATLTYAMFQLVQSPQAIKTLRDEVTPYVSATGVDHVSLQKCEFLNAVIDETLRLHPPVPSGLIRITPPEGITIRDTYIPGGTHLQLPLYSIQRFPAISAQAPDNPIPAQEAYVQPDDFIPERWTSKPELVKQKGAWAPFSLGPFGCVGKGLAYMEVRTVLARLVVQFDFALADGEDGRKLLEDTEDHFTLNLGDLYLTCRPRKG